MSVERFKNEMIAAKNAEENLIELNSNSKTSIWGLIFYCAAYAMDVLYQMYLLHRKEIDEKIANQKTHRLAWIQQMYLKFQYGFELKDESDQFDNDAATLEEIEAAKIIKYCAVNESSSSREVIIKIATETDNELAPLPQDKMEAVIEYTKRIKGAGVPYRVINYLPDRLKLNLRIYRDPLVLNANGMDITTGKFPVEDALQEFMKELPFNGQLRLQDMANKLEQVKGVDLVSVDLAQSCWINASTNNYGDWTTIDVRKIPESGYFKIEDFNGIRYEV